MTFVSGSERKMETGFEDRKGHSNRILELNLSNKQTIRKRNSKATFESNIRKRHSRATLESDIRRGHSKGTFKGDIQRGQSKGTFKSDIRRGHSKGTFESDIRERHSRALVLKRVALVRGPSSGRVIKASTRASY